MHKKSAPLMWRNLKENYRLIGGIEDVRGVIESFTFVYSAPTGYENQVPYILALISLDNGEKIISQIVDSEEVLIGSGVEPCLRKIYVDGDSGIIHYGTKFKVVK